jgi:hypothetical protein
LGVWIVAAAIFVVWLVCVFVFGKGGYIHITLLIAVSTALSQFLQDRRAGKRW